VRGVKRTPGGAPDPRERIAFDLPSTFHAAVAGALTGGLAVAFRMTLEWVERIHAQVIAALAGGPAWGWGALIAAFAALGAVSGWLIFDFAPEGSGSGIPHIERRLTRQETIRWRILLPVKFVGGLFALAAGMSLGREGPTVQMGGAIGEATAERVGADARRRWALVAAGAGAGLTAAFNAPLAGFTFVVEELRRDPSVLTYTTGLTAALVANLTMLIGLGAEPIFRIPDAPELPFHSLPVFVVIGILCGVLGVFFNRALLGTLDAYERWRRGPRWLHTASAGALAGLTAWALPQAIGGGEMVAGGILAGTLPVGPLRFLAMLVVLKLLLTVVSYGSGAPGGLFAPLLLLGAALGAMVGLGTTQMFAPIPAVPACAMAGMVGLFTASVRVPITGVVLILEMTNGQHQLLEFVVTSLAAYLVAAAFHDRPVYEALLQRDLAREARQR
jgi:chloride channel protein, CIC family